MIKAVAKFWGATKDAYGMPIPYHSYLIVASPWNGTNGGVASVVPLSTSAPLSTPHYPVLNGGERAAFDSAVKALKEETANSSLSFQVDED